MFRYVSAVLLALSIYLGIDLRTAHRDLATAVTTISDYEVKVGSLEASLKQMEQNGKDVDTLVASFQAKFQESKTLDEQRHQAVVEALKSVEQKTSTNVALSNKLLSSTPQSSDLCAEANNLINAYLDEVNK